MINMNMETWFELFDLMSVLNNFARCKCESKLLNLLDENVYNRHTCTSSERFCKWHWAMGLNLHISEVLF